MYRFDNLFLCNSCRFYGLYLVFICCVHIPMANALRIVQIWFYFWYTNSAIKVCFELKFLEIFLWPIILLRLSRGTPSVKNIVANVWRAVWNVTFCSVTIPAFSISLPIYVLQVALDGIGNTKSFLVTPRYFPMISLGISKRRTLEATSDFFLRLIILGVRQRKTGYCSISVF